MVRSLFLLALLAITTLPASAKRPEKYTTAQFDAWAVCAVEKNSDEIIWWRALSISQPDAKPAESKILVRLSGPARYGAEVYSAIILGRDCAPSDVRMDNDYFDGMAKAVDTHWKPTADKRSIERPMDKWTDCVVDKYGQLAIFHLGANDLGVAGMPVTGDGIDPHKAIFDETPDCNTLRDAGQPIDYLGVYARINFKMRIEPQIKSQSVATKTLEAGVVK
jgi:hypothetical protein